MKKILLVTATLFFFGSSQGMWLGSQQQALKKDVMDPLMNKIRRGEELTFEEQKQFRDAYNKAYLPGSVH